MSRTWDERWDDSLAGMLAPKGTRYLIACKDCRETWSYKRECETTIGVRNRDVICPNCERVLEFIFDSKALVEE